MSPVDVDQAARALYSAVVSDSCDHAGLRGQVLAPGLRSVLTDPPVLVGWARTMRSVAVNEAPARHYGTEIDYVDSLRPGDVVVAQIDGVHSGVWGELFSTAAMGRGARGAVIDGLVRDQLKIEALGFPVYALGSDPADSLGRLSIIEQDGEIVVRGVAVSSGDLVVADVDGVVIVPGDVAASVVDYALTKASIENHARDLLLAGGKLADVWERYRVL